MRNKKLRSPKTNTKSKLIAYIVALCVLTVIYLFLRQYNLSLTKKESTAETVGNVHSHKDDELTFDEPIDNTYFRKDGELTFSNQRGLKIVTIDIEIADDDDTIQQGLMHREYMEERQGMLFIFQPLYRPREISMWMKNTIIPLDMIFVKNDKTIANIAKDTVPFDLTGILSEEPVSYVIEVNAGFTDKYGIEPGMTISW